ncbi:fungal-specific transcription factor domain-containing protein [Choanephora cucurbitarum]|nr:fungal-specific transcription factor domain-containing protein [Choanephora cucurbitarum]
MVSSLTHQNELPPLKRPRSSLACIRCRKKKVKCDFIQPTCSRCANADLVCDYATPPRRVDGLAFDKLGGNVEDLKERMQRTYRELIMMRDNMHPMFLGKPNHSNHTIQPENQQVKWKISFVSSGLRIDTNIANIADLYRILLNGIRQLNVNHDNSAGLSNVISDKHRNENNSLSKPSWEKNSLTKDRLWEVNDSEAQKILTGNVQPATITTSNATMLFSKETLKHLVQTCYHSCFLPYQILDQDEFMEKYNTPGGLEPILMNSIHAWVSKHGCIYHNTPHTYQNPATIGESYFLKARKLLKKRFDQSNFTTIQALLNLYMYQLSSERSNLAYLYIGLAIRMAQDLKLHKKDYMPSDPKEKERNKRLWWSAYWLDLDAALGSNRPTMVDDKDIDIDYPSKLDSEDQETGYRIQFSVEFIKLMRIRKDIAKHLPSEQSGQSLLSAISRLEAALTNWLHQLPHEFKYDPNNDNLFVKTGSFRDEAQLILNIAYQATWIMLHRFFVPKVDQPASPVALLSLDICTKSATLITAMLEIYAAQCHWCHLFYTLDGILASVSIHRLNAAMRAEGEEEMVSNAQRHLLLTAYILRSSPLIYKEKVIKIVESIDDFFKSHNLESKMSFSQNDRMSQFDSYQHQTGSKHNSSNHPVPVHLSTEQALYCSTETQSLPQPKMSNKSKRGNRKSKQEKEHTVNNSGSILLTDPNSSLVNFSIHRMNSRKNEEPVSSESLGSSINLLNDRVPFSCIPQHTIDSGNTSISSYNSDEQQSLLRDNDTNNIEFSFPTHQASPVVDMDSLLMSDVVHDLLYNTSRPLTDQGIQDNSNRIYLTSGDYFPNRKRPYQE